MTNQNSDWITTSTVLQSLKDFENETAWNRFTARFTGPIKAFAMRLGLGPGDVDDATQEVLLAFAQAYRGGHYDRSKGRLSSWLFGIAYRQIANFRRKRLERGHQDNRGALTTFWIQLPDEHTAQRTWDAAWEYELLQSCVQQVRTEVSDNAFRVFEMTVREEQSPEKVAETLGMTRNAVYVAKHRVLNRLQELIQAYDDVDSQK